MKTFVAYLVVKLNRGLHAMQLVQRRSLRVTVNASHISVVVHPRQRFPGEMPERLEIVCVVAGGCIHMCPKRVVVSFRVGLSVIGAILLAGRINFVHFKSVTITIFRTIVFLEGGNLTNSTKSLMII